MNAWSVWRAGDQGARGASCRLTRQRPGSDTPDDIERHIGPWRDDETLKPRQQNALMLPF